MISIIFKSNITGAELLRWPEASHVPQVGEYIRLREDDYTYRLNAVVKVVWITDRQVEVYVP